MEKVGTPENISDEAREGFEETIKPANDISEADLKSPDLERSRTTCPRTRQKKVEAFTTYLNDTCGIDVRRPRRPRDASDGPPAPAPPVSQVGR